MVNNNHKYTEYFRVPNEIIIGGSDLSHHCSPKRLNSSCASPSRRAHENISSPCGVRLIIGRKINSWEICRRGCLSLLFYLTVAKRKKDKCLCYRMYCINRPPFTKVKNMYNILKMGSSYSKTVSSHTGQLSLALVIGGHQMLCSNIVYCTKNNPFGFS